MLPWKGALSWEDLRLRSADRVWQAGFSDDETPPLLILLEFQSTPDRRMSLRILEYRRLLLEEAVNREAAGPGGGRPPVRRDRDLQRGRTLAPWVIWLRGLRDRRGLRLAGSAMWTWMERVVVPRHGPGLRLKDLMESERDDEEVRSMLAERVHGWWHEEPYEQGLKQGLEQGRKRGLEQGRKDMLVQQAAMKFGPDAAGELSRLLRGVSDPARVAGVAAALIECTDDAEFMARTHEAVGPSR